MFTVKVIDFDNNQYIQEFESFFYEEGTDDYPEKLICYKKDQDLEDSLTITDGIVYIMNSSGRTVANYALKLDIEKYPDYRFKRLDFYSRSKHE